MKKIWILLCLFIQLGYAQSVEFDVSKYPFSCRGSYLSIFRLTTYTYWGVQNEKDGLFIRNISGRSSFDYMIRLETVDKEGVVDPEVKATPEKLLLKTPSGSAEICFENPSAMRIRTNGLNLKLSPRKSAFLLENGKGHLRLLNGPANDFFYMLTSLDGNMAYRGTPVLGKEKTHPNLYGELSIMLESGSTGRGEFVLEEFQSEWKPRPYTVPFDSCVSGMHRQYADWQSRFVVDNPQMKPGVDLAAYVSWSCLVGPKGQMKREGMYMSKNWMNMIWSWDHCFNAMAMAPVDKQVAWDQMMCIFDHQNAIGALPDGFDDQKEYWGIVKTPIHGWALRYLMQNYDWVNSDYLSQIYEPLSRWTNFWFTYRDYDGNGIPHYNHSYESFDDTTPLDVGFPLEAPELCTFLALQMDVLSEVAAILGKGPEAQQWKERTDRLVRKMIEQLWTGERFVARRLETGQWNRQSIDFLQYVPLLLGDKLPVDIRRKMIAGLKSSGLITPFGIATESLASPFFDPESYTRGSIWAPINIFIIDGLMKQGEQDLAKQLRDIYCKHLTENGFPESFSAKDGKLRSDPEYTWTSSVFLFLQRIK